MRLWLILLVGLLCFALTSCPAPEDEYEDQQTAIDDEGMRQPDFTEEEVATTDEEAAAVCEVCGQDPCVCGDTEDEMAPGEYCEKCGQKDCDGTCEGEGGYCTHCGMKDCDGSCMAAEEVEEPAADGEEEADVPEGEEPEEGEE
jgi:hypothetical protein